jgi:O-acetylserine/cysteine efflux transporter
MPGRHLVLVTLVCLVWAFNFTAGAKGMQHFPPLLFMILRFSLVLLAVTPLLRLPPRNQWPRLISVSLLIGTFHFTMMFWALARSSDVSSVVLVQHTYIPMAVVLAIPLLGERVGWRSLAATAIAFSGVMLIGFDPLVLSQPDVLAITLVSALFQALGSIYMRDLQGVSVFSFQGWTAVISLPFLLLATLLFEKDHMLAIQTAQWTHWGSVAYSAILASLVGHGLFYYLIQRHPVTAVMPYMLLAPLFGVVFGTLVWGDRPGWKLLLGGLLVLLGILIITLRAKLKTRQLLRARD